MELNDVLVYDMFNDYRVEPEINKKIQDLADSAKELVPKGILAPDLWIQEYNRIFAELIIRDCVSIIHEQERIPKEFFYAKSAHQHELAIKQHFGVK